VGLQEVGIHLYSSLLSTSGSHRHFPLENLFSVLTSQILIGFIFLHASLAVKEAKLILLNRPFLLRLLQVPNPQVL
jgi:hypothetical protein